MAPFVYEDAERGAILSAGESPTAAGTAAIVGTPRLVAPAASAVVFAMCVLAVLASRGAVGPPQGNAGDTLALVALERQPFSVSPRAYSSQVLERLWKVERILVRSRVCPAATPEVDMLRRQQWPDLQRGVAPRISKVVYINLQWDAERRSFMESQLQQLHDHVMAVFHQDLQWERFPATGKQEMQTSVDLEWWRQKGFSQAASPDVRGDWATAACAYSHYSAMSMVPEIEEGLILITEDDIQIDSRFLETWEHLWPYIPEDWDILRVSWFSDHQNCTQVVNDFVDRAGWQDPHNGECAYCGAQAYIMNPRSKDRVLKRFELSKITHADELLGAPTPQLEDPAVVPEIKAYMVMPMMASIAYDGEGRPRFGSDRIDGRKVLRH